tara:strand:+ start:85 stop:732 length:648 start_codon:yes stop_codon:yes gene_type:complete
VPKKLSEIQKKEMINSFCNGMTIDQLSDKYKITKITITRNLKKEIDEKNFKRIVEKNRNNKIESTYDANKNKNDINTPQVSNDEIPNELNSLNESQFIEITPLDFEIDSESQKDLSSVSIRKVELPNIVYMVVNNKIELETKHLKDYPEWRFLSQSDLNRKTIEIFFEAKEAKRFCNKEQKVIKVPNTKVFSIVAPILISRGISRIVCPDKLIAL